MNRHLLIIDPQADFCSPQGSLFVTGADQDAIRLGNFIERNKLAFDGIHVTMDSHHEFDIAHPIFWVNRFGDNPSVFTIITNEDIKTGKWQPSRSHLMEWALYYTAELEKKGRYPLCIWPPHCIIGRTEKRNVLDSNGNNVEIQVSSQDGTDFGRAIKYDFCGHAISEPVSTALSKWCNEKKKTINFISKGSNYKTEHYSAVKAEVVDPDDSLTDTNNGLLEPLYHADEVIVAGEALSHCVKSTMEDIFHNLGDSQIKKFILLTDCTSNVAGFEKNGTDFVTKYMQKGMRVTESSKISFCN